MLLRKSIQCRAIPARGAGVLHELEATIALDREAKGIIIGRTARERLCRLHQVNKGAATHLGIIEVLVPALQVGERGHNTALPHKVVVPDIHAPPTAIRRIRCGAARNDLVVIVKKQRLAHTQRTKERRVGKAAQ